MALFIALLGLLPLLVFAMPTTNLRAAGGPIAKPIPSKCTVINPLPRSNCSIASLNGWKPRSNLTTLYGTYFDLLTPAKELWQRCSEQCYGYGDKGECKSAFLAENVATPKGYHGSAGGQLATACLMLHQHLTPNDFEKAADGQYLNATAGSIYCEY